MLRRRAIRWAVALALAAGLASPALASPRTPKMDDALGLNGLWEAAASWLALAWTSLDGTTADVDRGSQMDPDGATSDSEGDRGLSMDPNGATSGSEGDRGSQIDPNG
jgi:hypothetical protein